MNAQPRRLVSGHRVSHDTKAEEGALKRADGEVGEDCRQHRPGQEPAQIRLRSD